MIFPTPHRLCRVIYYDYQIQIMCVSFQGDLWGPLILCTFLAAILHGTADDPNTNDGGPEFAQVFVMVWIGAMIVTLNSKLLGGNM